MIRVLKQANFANSNIGTIDIPIDDTVEALAFVAKYSGIVKGSETEIKAKQFINILVRSGVYNKLTYLAVPCLASNINEALQNALLESGQPTPTANMTFENHGLGFNAVGNFGLKPYRSQALTAGQYAFGMCVEYPNPWVNSNCAMSRNTNAHSKYARIVADYYDASSSSSNIPGYIGQISNNYKATFRIGSIDGTNNKGIQIVDVNCTGDEKFAYTLGAGGAVVPISAANTEDIASINNTFIGGLSSTAFEGHYKLFFESKDLTQNEVIIMRDAIASLCDVTI